MEFKGHVALITGAANGIGRATALAFAARGAKVVGVDRDAEGVARVAQTIQQQGGEAVGVGADVTKSADVQRYVKTAVDTYGRIDCFFNNAGIEGKFAPIAEYDEDVFDAVIGVNLKGVFLGLRHVLPVMIAQQSGAIVNTASVAGITGTPGLAPYTATKHAVIGLTKSVSGEVARQGIRINAVCPGPVDTRMIHSIEAMIDPGNAAAVQSRYQSSIPLGRYTTVDEIANMVLFLCSDLATSITGGQYVVDGGRTATGGAASTVAAPR